MSVPDFQSFLLPVLSLLGDGIPRTVADVRTALPEIMKLMKEDLEELLPSGTKTRFEDRVNWSITYLYQAVLLTRPRRGVYEITDRGREFLSEKPAKITSAMLNRFPEFREFNSARPQEHSQPQPDRAPPAALTPEERIENGFQELRDALAKELLDTVKRSPPQFFERLVVRLLVAMGYGGSMQDAGRAVGRSGDGGVDGIIKEDKLGLDNVYIQAKRYSDQNVSSAAVREFIGSLTLRRAGKGVLITTSDFTADAKSSVETLDKRIVLIDGTRLAQLMIEHDVGVTTHRTYSLKKLDQDFFEDD